MKNPSQSRNVRNSPPLFPHSQLLNPLLITPGAHTQFSCLLLHIRAPFPVICASYEAIVSRQQVDPVFLFVTQTWDSEEKTSACRFASCKLFWLETLLSDFQAAGEKDLAHPVVLCPDATSAMLLHAGGGSSFQQLTWVCNICTTSLLSPQGHQHQLSSSPFSKTWSRLHGTLL